jgi:hypothetical protein
MNDLRNRKWAAFEEHDQPKPNVGDIAGVYAPIYLDGVIEAVHDDGTATLRVREFRVRCLPDDSDCERYETTWAYDWMDPRWSRVEWY